jgi:hypothetical protein
MECEESDISDKEMGITILGLKKGKRTKWQRIEFFLVFTEILLVEARGNSCGN